MNKQLLSVLLAAAFVAPAFAADAPKPEAKVAKVADTSGQLVTPESDAAAMKAFIAQRKAEAIKAKAAKKPAEAKPEEAKPAEAKKVEEKKAEEKKPEEKK